MCSLHCKGKGNREGCVENWQTRLKTSLRIGAECLEWAMKTAKRQMIHVTWVRRPEGEDKMERERSKVIPELQVEEKRRLSLHYHQGKREILSGMR